jgi:hypothetical protein
MKPILVFHPRDIFWAIVAILTALVAFVLICFGAVKFIFMVLVVLVLAAFTAAALRR